MRLSGLIGTAKRPDMQKNPYYWGFSLKTGYNGSFNFGCYYLRYVPAYKSFDHAWFEVLEAITLYCALSDNR